MKHKAIQLLLLFFSIIFSISFSFSPSSSLSAVLSVEEPDDLSLCYPDTMHISFTNTGITTINSALIDLSIVDVFHYVPNSVSNNAQEANIINTNNPIFEIQQISPGQQITISLLIEAFCSDYDAIFGDSYAYTLSASYDGGATTPSLTGILGIDVPVLILNQNSITNNPASGVIGDQLERDIPIFNSSLGSLDSFTFRVAHDPGIFVNSISPGTIISQNSTGYIALISGSDFQTIGNFDTSLDLDEEIIVTESISIIDCIDSESSYFYEWGCGNEFCQQDSATAFVDVIFDEFQPVFTVTENLNILDCYCGDTPVPQQLTFHNVGNDHATDFELRLRDINSAYGSISGIDGSSIVVKKNNILIPHTLSNNISVSTPYLQTCFGTTEYFGQVEIEGIGDLNIGDSITIEWDMYFCGHSSCTDNDQTGIYYKYYYHQNCPTTQQSSINFHQLDYGTYAFLSPDEVSIEEGESISFDYILSSQLLNQGTGTLALNVLFTGGTTWPEADDFALETNTGQVFPTSLIHISPLPNVPPDSLFGEIQLLYDLPASTQASTSFNLEAGCGDELANIISIVSIDATIYLSENCTIDDIGCGIDFCQSTSLLYTECNIDPGEYPGTCIYNYKIGRDPSSWGLADNDNNRIPDETGSIEPSLIRTDRAVTSDTLLETIDVRIETLTNQNDYQKGSIIITLDNPLQNNSPLLSDTGIVHFSSVLEIFDNSNNTFYYCNDLPFSVNNFGGNGDVLIFTYDISLQSLFDSNCDLPADFVFESSDLLSLSNRYIVKSGSYSAGDPEQVNAFPDINLISNDNTDTLKNVCPVFTRALEISGYRLNTCFDKAGYALCRQGSKNIANLYFQVSNEVDFFPYEFRNFGYWDQIKVKASNFSNLNLVGFDFFNAEIQIGHYTNTNVADLSDYCDGNYSQSLESTHSGNISFSLDNEDFYNFDLKNYFDNNLQPGEYPDENSFIFINLPFETSCNSELTDSIDLQASFVFNQNHPEQILNYSNGILNQIQDSVYFLQDSEAIQLNTDLDISITNLTPQVIGYEANITWLFGLSFYSFYHLPNDSIYLWLKPEILTGEFSDLYVEIDGEMMLAAPDEVYQQKISFNQFYDLQLHAQNNSCQAAKINLQYGFSCSLLSLEEEMPCKINSTIIEVLPEKPTIVLDVNSPVGTFDLCAPINGTSVGVINSDIGSAYNINFLAQLPIGLELTSGSSTFAYPQSSPFNSIPNGNSVNGFYSWQLENINNTIALNGLPGALSAPLHSCRFQFEFNTNCDFIANSYPIFTADYFNNCSEENNAIYRAGDPIQITGVIPPYSSNINVQVDNISDCQDIVNLTTNIIINEQSLESDQIFITLPLGASYAENSLNVNNGGISGEPNISIINDKERLEWPIPLAPLNNILFSIDIDSVSNIKCGNDYFLVQTVSLDSALCVATNEFCTINVQTGDALKNIFVDRPRIKINNFQVDSINTVSQDTELLHYSFQLSNYGALESTNNLFVVDYYYDSDADNLYSVNDYYISSDSIYTSLPPDSTFLFSENFLSNKETQSCNIIAVLNGAKQCICQSDEARTGIGIPIIYTAEETVCSADSISLGKEFINNAFYSWSVNGAAACDTCANLQYAWNNFSDTIRTESVTLFESINSNCLRQYVYNINVLPYYNLIPQQDSSVCHGEILNLNLSAPLDSINWFVGDSLLISNNDQFSLAIINDTDSITVEGINSLGCKIEDHFVIINSSPDVFLNSDTILCESQVIQLNVFDSNTNIPVQQNGFTYNWGAHPGLSCLDCPNPILEATQTANLFVEISDSINCPFFDSLFVIVLDTSATFLTNTICAGEIVTIGNNEYTQNGNFTTALNNQNNCDSTVFLNLTVLDTFNITINSSICEGESNFVGGNEYTQTGIYIHNLSTFQGCDSMVTLNLIVNDTAFTILTEEICIGESYQVNDTIAYSSSGVYSNTLLTENGCDSTVLLNLEVLDVAEPVIVPNQIELCEGEAFLIDIIGNYTGSSPVFYWTTPSGSTNNSTTQFIINEVATTDAGLYTLRVFHENCFSEEISLSLAVYPIPQAPLVSAQIDYCIGDISEPLTAIGTELLWFNDSLSLPALPQAPNPNTDTETSYSYWVSQTVNGCESSRSRINISVYANPVANAGNDLTLSCEDPVLLLDGTASTGNIGYLWQTTDGNIIEGANGPNPTINQNGDYLLQVYNLENNLCADEDIVHVSIDSAAPIAIIEPLNATALDCNDTILLLTAEFSSPPGILDYQWTTNDGNIIGGDNNSPVIELDQSGYYEVLLTNQNNGCTASEIFFVEQISYPAAFAGNDTIICDSSILLNAVLPTGMIGEWTSTNGQLFFSDPFSPTARVSDLNIGNNDLTWTIAYPDCPDIDHDQLNISVIGLPPVAREDHYTFPSGGFETELDVVANDDLNNQAGSWNIDLLNMPTSGDIQIQNTSTFFCRTPLAGEEEMVFKYTLCNNICPEVCDTATVTVTPDFACFNLDHIFTPSIITPNDDGLNDVFYVDAIDYCPTFNNASLTIVNRWGSEIYHERPYKNNWDGLNAKGKRLPEGTYYYMLRLDLIEGIVKAGSVTIVYE